MTGTFYFRHSNMNVRPKAIEVNRPELVENARKSSAARWNFLAQCTGISSAVMSIIICLVEHRGSKSERLVAKRPKYSGLKLQNERTDRYNRCHRGG